MKKLIITLICLAVVSAGSVVGYKQYTKKQFEKIVVDVNPVNLLLQEDWQSSYETYGTVIAGNSQKVNLDDARLIKKVLVKEGDEVKIGTPLLEYDLTVLDLETDQMKNAVEIAKSNISQAKKELSKLQNLKPSESMPKETEPTTPEEPDEPNSVETPNSSEENKEPTYPKVEVYELITAQTTAHEGKGTIDDPYIFNCSMKTVVNKTAFMKFAAASNYVEFHVYSDKFQPLYIWSVNSTNIPKSPAEAYLVSSNVVIAPDGSVEFQYSEGFFGMFKVILPEDDFSDLDDTSLDDDFDYDLDDDYDYDEPADDFDNNDESEDDISEDYMYSRTELNQMIEKKQIEIKGLEIEQRSAEVEYQKALKEQADGKILSSINGTIKSVQDPDDINPDKPFILVQSKGTLNIQGYISESYLSSYGVGTQINVQSWESGTTVTATITEIISDTAYDGYYYGESNPNTSVYLFNAEINEECDFATNDGVMITFGNGNSTYSKNNIPISYVNQENGRYYVMKADENDKLVKQYVKTGKIINGYLIEIKGGLNYDDRICFPYGKNVKEGVKTKDTNEIMW